MELIPVCFWFVGFSVSHTAVLKISYKNWWFTLHLFCLLNNRVWTNGICFSYFKSPICCAICAPHSGSALHWTGARAAGNLTAWSPNYGAGVCTGNQAIAGSHMSYPAPVLRHKWRQFLLAARAEAKHASGRACAQPDRDRRLLGARLLRRLREEGGLCLCWPRAPRSTSADLTFSRPRSPTNSADTQGEGGKWRERESGGEIKD